MDRMIAEFNNSASQVISVYKMDKIGLYNTYVDGICTQYDLTAEDVIRWLAHTSHKG